MYRSVFPDRPSEPPPSGFGLHPLGDRSTWRKKYKRHTEEEWVRLEALYRAGVPARALARRYGGSERTIFRHMQRRMALHRDQPLEAQGANDPPTDQAFLTAMAELRQDELTDGAPPRPGDPPVDPEAADLECQILSPDATPKQAARAATTTAIQHMRKRNPRAAGAYLRLANSLVRLDQALAEPQPESAEDPPSPARLSAIAVLHASWHEERARYAARDAARRARVAAHAVVRKAHQDAEAIRAGAQTGGQTGGPQAPSLADPAPDL